MNARHESLAIDARNWSYTYQIVQQSTSLDIAEFKIESLNSSANINTCKNIICLNLKRRSAWTSRTPPLEILINLYFFVPV